jgi:hypothetical protein
LRLLRSPSRAGSPLLFGLAPRGVFRASPVARRAVGSYPTVSPLPAKAPLIDDEQVSLPPVTAALFRGGLFSVALSVTLSLRRTFVQPRNPSPGVTRRVAHFSADADRCPDFPPAPIARNQRSPSSPASIIILPTVVLRVAIRVYSCVDGNSNHRFSRHPSAHTLACWLNANWPEPEQDKSYPGRKRNLQRQFPRIVKTVQHRRPNIPNRMGDSGWNNRTLAKSQPRRNVVQNRA